MTNAVEAKGLARNFGATRALAGVDLTVREGTVLGLLGPNGAGKTTVVRVLATLLAPDAGEAWVGGYNVRTQAHQVRQLVGLTGQYASVDERLTGRENLLMIARLRGLSHRAARARADALLADFNLSDASGRAAKTYSGGMRRRLDLAASLVGRPRILFLDEPTTGLDPRARMDLWNLVRGLVNDGTTVLLTTQYLDEADQLADDIVVIDQGQVIAAGTPEQLKARVGHRALVVGAVSAADVPAIRAAVAELSGAVPEVSGLRVTVPTGEPELLPAVLRRLDAEGIPVNEMMLRSASLDDVFLSITGRHVNADGVGGNTGDES